MVHDHQLDYPRDNSYRASPWPPVDHAPDGGRYANVGGLRRPPMAIDKALREECNIPAKSFFLVAVLDDGQTRYFSGPDGIPPADVPAFFNQPQYAQYLRDRGTVPNPIYIEEYHRQLTGPPYTSRRSSHGRTLRPEYSDESFAYNTKPPSRKRHRGSVLEFAGEDAPVVSSKRKIRIGDEEEVWDYYGLLLRNCQQTLCKLIAKAWIKVIEPKKQSNHPYTGKDDKAPGWWPKPWGPTRDEKVRHKEPDHLYKKERVHLIQHCLRLVVKPNAQQHPDIQKLNLNVAKLEEATTDALSSFFSDKDNTNNFKKKRYLKELFKLAKAEERYRNGEIDASTMVYVLPDDKSQDDYQSDNEDSGSKDEEHTGPSSVSSRTSNPHGLVAPLSASTDHSPAGPLQGGPFVSGDIPVRSAPYLPSELGAEQQHAYVEGGAMPTVGGHHAPTLQSMASMAIPTDLPSHDASRRPSVQLYTSPAEYSNPSSAGMYNTSNWGHTATTAPSGPSMYANNAFPQQHQHSLPPLQSYGQQQQQQQQQPMSQTSPYMGTSYDGLPRYDHIGHASVYRHTPAQAYDYIGHDSRPVTDSQLKLGPAGGRHPL